MKNHIIDVHQRHFDAIFSLGANFFFQGKNTKALIIFEGLMALDPENLRPALLYGEVLIQEGKLENAVDHFENLHKKFANDESVLFTYAKALILLDRISDAQDLLKPFYLGERLCSSESSLRLKTIFQSQPN